MPTPTSQNLNNTEVLFEAPELIEFFKKADNPWAQFFPIQKTNYVNVKFIVKKPSTNVQKVSDKSTRLEVEYVDTDTIQKTIENMYTHGEKIAEVDLEAENGQDLQSTMSYEVANNLNNQIGKDDTLAIGTYATVVEIPKDDPITNLTAMLTAWDKLFQLRNSANCKFFITNELYDKLVYLANNKGIITDNTIAQQLRLDGSTLFVKGVECQINLDDYMTFGSTPEKIPFILATPKALKRYYLMNMKIYREPVNDGKLPKMILIGGEVMSDAIPYLAKTENNSRWMFRGKYNINP